jgi:hypothetical protein
MSEQPNSINQSTQTMSQEPVASVAELAVSIAQLKQRGAQKFNPVRFQFIETMAGKAAQQRETVSRIVAHKIYKAVSQLTTDFNRAQQQAASINKAVAEEFPDYAESSQDYFSAGDFKALKQLAARLNTEANARKGGQAMGALALLSKQINSSGFAANNRHKKSTFAEMLRRQESDALHSYAAKAITSSASSQGQDQHQHQADLFNNNFKGQGTGELDSVRLFRESLVKLNSDQLVTRVISEGPENPGPLNPQALVIRSLATIRELSPDYLNRFVSYMDTLLWLEQASEKKKPSKRKPRKRPAARS